MASILLGVLATVAVGIYGGLTIEQAQIAVHWNAAGEPDRYENTWFGMMVIPAASAFTIAMVLLLPKMNTRKDSADVTLNNPMVATTAIAITWLMLAVQVFVYLSAIGIQVDMIFWVTFGVGALFVVLGNVMTKIRPNQFVGIRTPWTLDNDEVWYHTHRLGGPLFVIAGLVSILAAFVAPTIAVFVLMAAALTAAVVSIGYSWYKFNQLTKA